MWNVQTNRKKIAQNLQKSQQITNLPKIAQNLVKIGHKNYLAPPPEESVNWRYCRRLVLNTILCLEKDRLM